MKNILVCNQKGGVGKSLIADELAFSFERSGIPICFFDMDGQGGVIHQTAQRDDAEIAVIDTPGTLQKDLRDWIDQADVIIIPTRATSRDIEPLTETTRIHKYQLRITHVKNKECLRHGRLGRQSR